MYACPPWGASNYSVGWLLGITEFRSFSSLHMIVTMFISKRFKLVLRDFCANRSARESLFQAGWIGLMKFTEYEAKGIQPLVAHSPLMSWMYGFLTVRAFSNALGVVEVAIAILIGLRHWSAKASALGSAGAVLMFLTTLSFLFSTPGWEPSLGGFPSLSALPGQFLLKDVVLLGAAIWSFGEAWTSSVRIHRKKASSP